MLYCGSRRERTDQGFPTVTLIAVEGPAGCGKTCRLVEALGERLAESPLGRATGPGVDLHARRSAAAERAAAGGIRTRRSLRVCHDRQVRLAPPSAMAIT